MSAVRSFWTGMVALSLVGRALGSGFGLYEPSAKYHAMGGAVVGRAIDASANFANPATLTDLTNLEVVVGFVTEHPRGTVSVNGRECKMDPGFFALPHLMVSAPLPYDFTFGLGLSAEYGLGTEYARGWPMNWSCYETTVQGLVLNPNLAYKITDDWSIAAGLRWLYFDFEQYKQLNSMISPGVFGHADYHLKGDNGCKGLGWQIGTKYDILDNLSVGVMYKAPIETTIEGHTSATPSSGSALDVGLSQLTSGGADADITLPQSITFGINWDPVDVWHLGWAASWTEWSEFDELVFNLKQGRTPIKLDWRDTWRVSMGSCWDFATDWAWMISYTYDMDCTSSHQESAMLPPASRHILATGLSWNFWANWEATLSYSCIFMHGFDMHATDKFGATGDYELKTQHGFCHAGGFSLAYRF